MKRVLVVGSGGREAAMVFALCKSPLVSEVFVAPANAGMEAFGTERCAVKCVEIKAMEFEKLAQFAVANKIDLAIIGADDPLVGGIVDVLQAQGVACFGPDKIAAQIEGSKAFAKELMREFNIPTAAYHTFLDAKSARKFLQNASYPQVIKADGLALGKGVVVAFCKQEALAALDELSVKFGEKFVIEEFLEGVEVSVLTLTDGKCIKPLLSATDHKRVGEGDTGLNTGGMGTVAPSPYFTQEFAKQCQEEIFEVTLKALNARGIKFKGCIFFGLMLTKNGAKVIEYNCRFGDPETQVVLPLLESDFFELCEAVANETLSQKEVRFKQGAAACVVLCSQGYPQEFERGFEIALPRAFDEGEVVFTAGVSKDQNGALVTNGGRVLGAVGLASELEGALKKAYDLAQKIEFKNRYFRRDIGKKALEFAKTQNC